MGDVVIPEQLEPLVILFAGQKYPNGRPSQLGAFAEVWDWAAGQFMALVDQFAEVKEAVLEGFSGPSAEAFGSTMDVLRGSVVQLSQASTQLAEVVRDIAVSIEKAQYSIALAVLFTWEQIVEWSSTVFGAAAVPAIEAAGRLTVYEILRDLFMNVAKQIAFAAGLQGAMDAAVQGLIDLKDHAGFDWKELGEAVGTGAMAGALAGCWGSRAGRSRRGS